MFIIGNKIVKIDLNDKWSVINLVLVGALQDFIDQWWSPWFELPPPPPPLKSVLVKKANKLPFTKKERILKINDVTIIINDQDPTRVFKIAKTYQINSVITFLQINRHFKIARFSFFWEKASVSLNREFRLKNKKNKQKHYFKLLTRTKLNLKLIFK